MSSNQHHEHDFSRFNSLIHNDLNTVIVDMDGTIVDSDITQLYLYIKRKESRYICFYYVWLVWTFIVYGPVYKLLDMYDRSLFQKVFYKKYSSYAVEEIKHYSADFFYDVLRYRFIGLIHELLFFLKDKNIKIILLSTGLEPVVRLFAEYFGIPFSCPGLVTDSEYCIVESTGLSGFKYDYVKRFGSKGLMVIADSKHDLSILRHAEYPVIVAEKKKRWMDQIQENILINKRLNKI